MVDVTCTHMLIYFLSPQLHGALAQLGAHHVALTQPVKSGIKYRGKLAQLGAHHVALTQPVKSGIKYRGELAQLGERVAGSDEVRGSSPLFSIRVWQKNGRVAVLFVYIYATVHSSSQVE
jgi:hypothetical protein